ncbi:MAG: hypothetical protein WCO58_02025 [bacterium]
MQKKVSVKKSKKIFQILFFAFIFLLTCSVQKVSAAKLDVIPTFGSVHVGDSVKVRVVLSSADQSANAVSSIISFSNDVLTLNSISKSDSIISLWPVEPSYSNTKGTVSIEGVILNGYKGSNGVVITLFFKAKNEGTAYIKFANASVLANDGQGTQILKTTGDTQFDIDAITEKKEVSSPKNTPIVADDENPTVQIDEIKKKDELDPRSKFFITSVAKKNNTSYKIEIDNVPYVWDDTGDHLFETIPLSKGMHTIKVSIETIDGDSISKTLSFNNTGITSPIFTDYSNSVNEDEYIVVKGKADPLTYVVISYDAIDTEGKTKHESSTVKSDKEGLFTYVSENRLSKGVYMISAIARTDSGIESEKTATIRIVVQENIKGVFDKFTNFFYFAIPVIGLLILVLILIIYGWHYLLHYRNRMHKKLHDAKLIINKSFSILEEDLDEEIKIFKKIKSTQPLSEDERSFINQFKKDIEAAERTIVNEIKDSDKDI